MSTDTLTTDICMTLHDKTSLDSDPNHTTDYEFHIVLNQRANFF